MPDRPRPRPNNVGASVRQRLLNLAHARGQPMDLLLTRYALERLLHRLSLSPHRERFVLKGAMLLVTWFDEPHRATRDVDLLGFGDAAAEALLDTFREIMAIQVDDGIAFDLKGLRIEAIREEVEYGGSRLRTSAAMAGARIPIVVDIGFGDAIEPAAQDINLPVLLNMPSPFLRAYPPETVIAEKLHAMVVLGMANSRMKDYYDVWMLTGAFEIDSERLRRAIAATFARRDTGIPADVPDGLGDSFAADPGKQRQWDAFARNLAGSVPGLAVVVKDLRERLAAPIASSRLT
jgi:predicted nucleotidyltransferase component of viral defense system